MGSYSVVRWEYRWAEHSAGDLAEKLGKTTVYSWVDKLVVMLVGQMENPMAEHWVDKWVHQKAENLVELMGKLKVVLKVELWADLMGRK